MSAILTAKGLAAGHADRLLFSGLDLVIAPGEITGLVGANGAGKSTLLRILAGLVQPDQGEVGLSPPAATVGYLAQEPERRPPPRSSPPWAAPRAPAGGSCPACPAARRPVSTSPRCCCPATTSSCSTSRPTTWTSPGWRSWKGSCGACGPEPSWSATTARFS